MKTYENEPGLARRFWAIADRVSGQGKRKKAGSVITVGTIVGTGIGVLASDSVSIVGALIGGGALITGLALRFFPERTVTEKEMKQAVAEAQAIDFDKLPANKQDQLANECGLSVHELAGKVNLIASSAKELAYKLGEQLGDRYRQLAEQVKANGLSSLNRKDKELHQVMEYAAALRIKETVS